ncbi:MULTISPECIES: hypothetical protein [unclassified Curtobacterium]|uniref:hypothetical protein n=1 Tax=unclassified Curtobacterium TaxID=257496 RepID=UPI000DA86331|nr:MULTISPECIES: hypothetical protein [unclassified Curtobacterium]PZF40511.1 hypothetical protein DEJ07_10620 [Curtobacterium sp. MCLR17_053]PZF47864.1 hypothetical protein DEJ06_13795 [Curtobacterium sp. MCLR17_051]
MNRKWHLREPLPYSLLLLTTDASGYGDDGFALVTPRRVVLMTLGLLVIIIGFVLMAHSAGRFDRLAAILVIFVGFALLLFTTARPGQAALARSWSRYERK